MKIAKYLGRKVSCLLEAEPFKNWPVERRVDDDCDPPVVGYTFRNCGLQLNCDREDESVTCLFLEAEEYAGTLLSEVSFDLSRKEVLAQLGVPSESGSPHSDPILGDYGPWDLFSGPEYTIHVEYRVDSDRIRMITLMRNDVVPKDS